jgi:alanyl-tRNA synthetase
MKSEELRIRFLNFFKNKGHSIIPSSSLLPENDSSVLFNTAGMQPLVPYLLGKKHPEGNRLANFQKCIRTGDIEDIGDNRHLTFFEMLGNWSLGDYFKKEAIEWSMEFVTDKEHGLGLDPKRIYVTVFKGEDNIPKDNESIEIWKEVFKKYNINADVAGEDCVVKDNIRIIPLGVKDNFWIAGETGPCGADTEIFYDTKGDTGVADTFDNLVNSFRFIEIWNNVFMEFNKTPDGQYIPLEKKNVDTGMGLERITAVVNNKTSVFDTDCFEKTFEIIDRNTDKKDNKASRIIADHIRAAVFIISDGIQPSNTDRGYILRRLIRRAIRYADILEIKKEIVLEIARETINKYGSIYPNIKENSETILQAVEKEEIKFRKTLKDGLKEFEKGTDAFTLFSSYGFPIDLTLELAKEKGIKIDIDDFNIKLKQHQDLSRTGAEKKFKGGLSGTGEIETKYHTATHLLHSALRKVLGNEVIQRGSNITPERMRFDFSYPQKMTDEQKKTVEDIVNEQIQKSLDVVCVEMSKDKALETGAIHAFGDNYGDKVTVYSIGNEKETFSKEFCGGPHVKNTKEIGKFTIIKEEAVSSGVRRIKAVIE